MFLRRPPDVVATAGGAHRESHISLLTERRKNKNKNNLETVRKRTSKMSSAALTFPRFSFVTMYNFDTDLTRAFIRRFVFYFFYSSSSTNSSSSSGKSAFFTLLGRPGIPPQKEQNGSTNIFFSSLSLSQRRGRAESNLLLCEVQKGRRAERAPASRLPCLFIFFNLVIISRRWFFALY